MRKFFEAITNTFRAIASVIDFIYCLGICAMIIVIGLVAVYVFFFVVQTP
jgi:hypothetical protein